MLATSFLSFCGTSYLRCRSQPPAPALGSASAILSLNLPQRLAPPLSGFTAGFLLTAYFLYAPNSPNLFST